MTKVTLTDYVFLLKGEMKFEIDFTKNFQDIKDIYFEKLKELNIETNDYCNENTFQLILCGKLLKMEDSINSLFNVYDIVVKVNFFKKQIKTENLIANTT
jgi:hypothetical protein